MPRTPARVREYFHVLWVRRWSVALIILLVTSVAAWYALQQPDVYTSTAEVQASNPLAAFIAAAVGGTITMGTEEAIAVSTPVTRCAYLLYEDRTSTASLACRPSRISRVKVPTWFTEAVTTDVPPLTNILAINFTDESPTVARRGAQAYAVAYVDYRYQQALTYVAGSAILSCNGSAS